MLTAEQLATATGATLVRARSKLAGLTAAMAAYDISLPQRAAMFLANVGHETMGLVHVREIWGPTAAQQGYEGRKDLGNVRPGDGRRFLGRGDLQTTGRANYARLRDRLRSRGIQCPDFEAEPEKLELAEWAALSACDYIDMRNLNAKADSGDFLGYCIGINGRNKATGLPNGWSHRTELYAQAQAVLT